MHLLLFDVDGVLVDDRGYRTAVIAVVNYFSQQMGLSNTTLQTSSMDVFHAHGFVNEWDYCPFILGILMVELAKRTNGTTLYTAPLESFLPQLRLIGVHTLHPPFDQYLAQADRVTGRPSQRALKVLLNHLETAALTEPTRSAMTAALYELLDDPYDFRKSPATQVFQEYIVGSRSYAETYQVPPRFDLPSLLLSEDRPLLKSSHKSLLDAWQRSGQAKTCVYTARFSQAPVDRINGLNKLIGYSPEAELAIDLVQMQGYPLIASGHMLWLAEQVQQPIESMTKPAPVQALAAIGAAISNDQSAALQAAYALQSTGKLISPLAELMKQSVEVWVVEDAMLGLQAARGAIDLLQQKSIVAHLHPIGIAASGPKAAVLQSLCDIVLPDVNAAIDHIARSLPSA